MGWGHRCAQGALGAGEDPRCADAEREWGALKEENLPFFPLALDLHEGPSPLLWLLRQSLRVQHGIGLHECDCENGIPLPADLSSYASALSVFTRAV